MPELPEVESMRRGIASVTGRRIETVWMPRGYSATGPRRKLRPLTCRPSAARIIQGLVGRKVASVRRLGKRILIDLTDERAVIDSSLVIEPRMTGLLLMGSPPTPTHVRLRISFDGDQQLEILFWDRRGLGTLSLVDPDGLEATCGAVRLGPDALSISAPHLQATLSGSRRPIKVALLDQRVVAGLGNIYACECLFKAGIDPKSPCRRLAATDWERLAASIRSILDHAIACGGSTLPDATYLAGPGRKGSYQLHHRVYGRESLACTICGNSVRRIRQAQRSTFYCPRCQNGGRMGRSCTVRVI